MVEEDEVDPESNLEEKVGEDWEKEKGRKGKLARKGRTKESRENGGSRRCGKRLNASKP